MPADSIFDGPVTNLLSVLCILIEFLLRARAKGAGWVGVGSLNDFRSGAFIGLFPSDSAASMAVKGLSRPGRRNTKSHLTSL